MADKVEVEQPIQEGSSGSRRAAWVGGIVALIIIIATTTVVALNKTPLKKPVAKTNAVSPVSVSITKDGFMPSAINARVGAIVTWTNEDTFVHQIAADPFPRDDSIPGFDSQQPLQPKDTMSFTLSKAGTYTYHDEKNPFKNKGVIVVQ